MYININRIIPEYEKLRNNFIENLLLIRDNKIKNITSEYNSNIKSYHILENAKKYLDKEQLTIFKEKNKVHEKETSLSSYLK